MKKLILILSILSLTACEKKTCWKCTIVNSYRGTGTLPPSTITNTTVCDKSKDEIANYEKSMTTSSTAGSVTVEQHCNCNQQ